MAPNRPHTLCPGRKGKFHGRFWNPTGQSTSYGPGQWGVLTILDQFQYRSQHRNRHHVTPRYRALYVPSVYAAAAKAALGIWVQQLRVWQQRPGCFGGGGCFCFNFCCPRPQIQPRPSPLVGKGIPLYGSLTRTFHCLRTLLSHPFLLNDDFLPCRPPPPPWLTRLFDICRSCGRWHRRRFEMKRGRVLSLTPHDIIYPWTIWCVSTIVPTFCLLPGRHSPLPPSLSSGRRKRMRRSHQQHHQMAQRPDAAATITASSPDNGLDPDLGVGRILDSQRRRGRVGRGERRGSRRGRGEA